jgi:hypothetical protein
MQAPARSAVIQRERAPDAAEQPRQGVRAQAGRPLALGLIALLPAALDADDEADGERDRQPPDELECIHGYPGALKVARAQGQSNHKGAAAPTGQMPHMVDRSAQALRVRP